MALQPPLLALGLELGDRGLLHDDLLARLGVGERAGLGLRRRARSWSAWNSASLIAVSRCAAAFSVSRLLLALGRLAVGVGLGDAGPHLHLGGARLAERLDVARRIDDLLDLQRVDDQAELLHLVRAGVARLLRELVAVGDQVLDREAADDRAQVAVEDLAHQVVHLRRGALAASWS